MTDWQIKGNKTLLFVIKNIHGVKQYTLNTSLHKQLGNATAPIILPCYIIWK
jgi:hypothetical protein